MDYKKLLLVEDDPDDQLFFLSALEILHFPVDFVIANNGKEAIELMQHYPADIIFTDLNMPLMNGLELISELKGRSEDLTIVAMSTSKLFAEQCAALGATLYWVKPMSISKLSLELNAILQGQYLIHQ